MQDHKVYAVGEVGLVKQPPEVTGLGVAGL